MSYARAVQLGALVVGETGVGIGASAQYPILGEISEAHSIEAAESVAGMSYQRTRITFATAAVAATLADVPDLIAATIAELTRRGERVTLTELGGSPREFLRQGVAGGAVRGYPTVKVTNTGGSGTWMDFDVEIETLLPLNATVAGAYTIVEHDYRIESSRDSVNALETRRSGTVRVANTQSAEAYVLAAIIGPARTAADAAGRTFTSKTTVTDDATLCSYEYTDSAQAGGGAGSGVTTSEVTDRTAKEASGRRRRTISGYATGGGATAYATSLRPTSSSTVILVRDDVSQPRLPDNRVDFSYETITGIAGGGGTGFPGGSIIFGFTETWREVGGGRQMQTSAYADAPPIRYLGPVQPYVYEQVIEVQYRASSWAALSACTACNIPSPFTADDLAEAVRPNDRANGDGTRTLTIRRLFVMTSQQTLPAAREVVTL